MEISLCSLGGRGHIGRPQPLGSSFLPSLPGFFRCSHGWGSLYPAPKIRGQELWAFGESAVSSDLGSSQPLFKRL